MTQASRYEYYVNLVRTCPRFEIFEPKIASLGHDFEITKIICARIKRCIKFSFLYAAGRFLNNGMPNIRAGILNPFALEITERDGRIAI